MREDLKRELDESVPKHITLSEEKKRQIMMAAQERANAKKPSRVPKFVPALVTVAVIGLSGVLVYPYLLGEETNTPGEVRGEEEIVPAPAGDNDDLEILPVEEEELPEETEDTPDVPATEETPEDTEAPKDPAIEEKDDTKTETADTTAPSLTKKEQFVKLLDHDYFRTGIKLGDEVADIEKNYPNWTEKGEYEGGITIHYDSFTLIHGVFETKINNVILHGFGPLTVAQIEQAIGQDIQLTTYFNEIQGREVISGEFVLEGYRYVVVPGSQDKNAQVKEISLSIN